MALPFPESCQAAAEFVVQKLAHRGWSSADACKVTEMHGGSSRVYAVECSEVGASPNKVVFKVYRSDPLRNCRMLTANTVFSEAGAAQAHVAAADNWCIELFSDSALYHVFDPAAEDARVKWLVRIAHLAAQIGSVPTDWFAPIRRDFQTLYPCLVDVPEDSPIWPCVAYNDPLKPGERACADLGKFTAAQLQQLSAALPLPASEAGRAAVSTHGDLHPGNIIWLSAPDELKVMDLEFSCVSNALQDFMYLPERSTGRGRRAFSSAYLEARGLPCTEADVEIFALDVIVATLVHYGVLRPLLMEWYGENIDMDEALARLEGLGPALLAIQADLESNLAKVQGVSSSSCAGIVDNFLKVRGMYIDEFIQASPLPAQG